MARFTRNSVEGKSEEARSGWRSRRDKARAKRERRGMDRAEIAAIRAAHAQTATAAEEQGFNPEAAGQDFVSALSDADLVALYKQLHDGRAPAPKAKRPTIEKAVRAKQAERAAEQAGQAADEPVGEGNTELTLEQLADGETVEGDDV